MLLQQVDTRPKVHAGANSCLNQGQVCEDGNTSGIKPAKPVAAPVEYYILLTVVALMLSVFAVEAYVGHFFLLVDRQAWTVWIPMIYAPIGVIATVYALFCPRPRVIGAVRWLMWTALAVGIAGMYFHRNQFLGGSEPLSIIMLGTGQPPALAPLSFVMAGITGLFATTLKLKKFYQRLLQGNQG